MEVTLLGPVSCRHEGEPLPLGGVKQRAVFALLALGAGRIVPMDRLIDNLWPDDPPAQAVVTLRAYVSRLRKILEPTPAHVMTRPPGWVLTLPPGATDLVRFNELLAQGRAAVAGGGSAGLRSTAQDLEEALGLWSGVALGDLAELQFARDEAARLEELHDAAVETLLDARLAVGDHEVVIERARRFVAERPFRERAWCALMVGLYRAGRQTEALEAYGALRRTLADELGLDPSPALQDLERQMLRHDPVLQPPAPAASELSPPPRPAMVSPVDRSGEVPEHPARTAAGWPVVGRDRAISELRRAAAAAVTGHGGLVVVSAPLGAGKTTVLQVLEDDVSSSGGRVLHGRGLGDEATPALWPWVTVLRELVDAQPDLNHGRWEPDAPAAVALAAIAPAQTDAPQLMAPLSRSLIFRGVIDLLREARARGPLVVVLDDAHWLDVDTRTLVALAVEDLADHGVLFVAAVRSDEPAVEQGQSLGSLRSPRMTRVTLDPLDRRDVAVLIEAIDGREPAPRVAAAVLERTGGNALFVTELVRLLSAERRLTTEAASEVMPDEVLDVLGRRLDRLPAPTVAILGLAALLAPGPFDLDLLARVSGSSEEQVLDACELALLAGLLVESPDGTGRFALSHGLVRQTLVARLSGARRVHLHAKIAAALQERNPEQTDEVLEVARQLVLAAPAVGSAAAVPYLVAAAEDALRRSATEAARSTLTTALGLVADIEDVRVQQSLRAVVQGQLDTVRMWAATFEGDPMQTPPTALAEPTDGPSVAAWLGTVVAWAVRGHYAWALTQASGLLAADPVAVAENTARYVRGYLSVLAGDSRTAREELDVLERLVADAGDFGVPGVLFHMVEDVYAYRALLELGAGDDTAADVELQQLARWSSSTKAAQVKANFYRCLVAAMRGDPAQARAEADQGRRRARQLDFAVFQHHFDVMQAWADALDGDPAGPARGSAFLASYRESGMHYLEPTYLMLIAEAYAHHGQLETARQRAFESQTRAGQLGELYLAPRLAALRAAITETARAGASTST